MTTRRGGRVAQLRLHLQPSHAAVKPKLLKQLPATVTHLPPAASHFFISHFLPFLFLISHVLLANSSSCSLSTSFVRPEISASASPPSPSLLVSPAAMKLVDNQLTRVILGSNHMLHSPVDVVARGLALEEQRESKSVLSSSLAAGAVDIGRGCEGLGCSEYHSNAHSYEVTQTRS